MNGENIKINQIETLGALDGPGLRTVIFFQGCPMRCLYCHNPDTFDLNAGEKKTVTELIDFCLRYKNFYDNGGGVTLSGGEPLMQEAAAFNLIKRLKQNEIHTALDTSGAVYSEKNLDAADLTILDIKHTNADKFFSLTNHNIENTIKSLEFLKKNNKTFWIRQVILPGFNDSVSQIEKLAEMSQGAQKIELLPYHTLGVSKWAKAGLNYKLPSVIPPDNEKMFKLNEILKQAIKSGKGD